MPELPDITVYLEALEARVLGQRLERIVITSPFLLRSTAPSPQDCAGRSVVALRRLGKRIAIGLDGDLWLVLHLMIAGRLHWYEPRCEAFATAGARNVRVCIGNADADRGGQQAPRVAPHRRTAKRRSPSTIAADSRSRHSTLRRSRSGSRNATTRSSAR